MSSEVEQYLYIANIRYFAPTQNVVGVYADNRTEAIEMVNQAYGQQLNFELVTLDVAPADIVEAYKKGIVS